jgi:hypothetical protein
VLQKEAQAFSTNSTTPSSPNSTYTTTDAQAYPGADAEADSTAHEATAGLRL